MNCRTPGKWRSSVAGRDTISKLALRRARQRIRPWLIFAPCRSRRTIAVLPPDAFDRIVSERKLSCPVIGAWGRRNTRRGADTDTGNGGPCLPGFRVGRFLRQSFRWAVAKKKPLIHLWRDSFLSFAPNFLRQRVRNETDMDLVAHRLFASGTSHILAFIGNCVSLFWCAAEFASQCGRPRDSQPSDLLRACVHTWFPRMALSVSRPGPRDILFLHPARTNCAARPASVAHAAVARGLGASRDP